MSTLPSAVAFSSGLLPRGAVHIAVGPLTSVKALKAITQLRLHTQKILICGKLIFNITISERIKIGISKETWALSYVHCSIIYNNKTGKQAKYASLMTIIISLSLSISPHPPTRTHTETYTEVLLNLLKKGIFHWPHHE